MSEVILTVGPRASGKSSFCERAASLDNNIVLISRDKLLVQMFGSTDICSYSGGHHAANERVWDTLRKTLRDTKGPKIILDTWNWFSEDRRDIIRELRFLRVEQITAWYFITPVEYVENWFWQKPGIAKISEMRNRKGQGLTFFSEEAPRRDYRLFHEFASDISNEGFHQVVKINPLITEPSQVLTTPA